MLRNYTEELWLPKFSLMTIIMSPLIWGKFPGKHISPAFIFTAYSRRFIRKLRISILHQYALKKQKNLLSENKQVTDVCNEVGFESLGSFSVLFKKEIGFAPTYYRNMAWLKKQQAKEQPKRFIPHCFIESYHLDKSNNR